MSITTGFSRRLSNVTISPFNRGLLYGDGLFETLRSYGGRVFRLEQHLKRMADGMQVLRIEHRLQAGDVEQAVYELLSRNKLSDASIRITLFRGDGEGPEPHNDLKPFCSCPRGLPAVIAPKIMRRGFAPI